MKLKHFGMFLFSSKDLFAMAEAATVTRHVICAVSGKEQHRKFENVNSSLTSL